MSDDLERSCLAAIRIAGLVETHELVARTGAGRSDLEALLGDLLAASLVVLRSGRLAGWQLTGEGRHRGEALLRAEVDAMGVRAELESAFDRFGPLNDEFLELCRSWQLRDGPDGEAPNDHLDSTYDGVVIGRLAHFHDQTVPLVRELGGALPRFVSYAPLLGRALQGVQTGETAWFTSPAMASYHSVWFELHEDLLATLGRRRIPKNEQPSKNEQHSKNELERPQ